MKKLFKILILILSLQSSAFLNCTPEKEQISNQPTTTFVIAKAATNILSVIAWFIHLKALDQLLNNN